MRLGKDTGRTRLRRFGLVLVAALVATTATPAYASTDSTGSIGGTITNGGLPVNNAEIVAYSADDLPRGWAYTNANGDYEFTGLPEEGSPYRISILAPDRPRQYAYGKTSQNTSDQFPVTAGQRTTVNDTLLPTGTIRGRYTDAAGNGLVANVWAIDVNNQSSYVGGVTDANGNYSLSVLPATYEVSFLHDNNWQYAYGTYEQSEATLFTVAVGQTVTVNDAKPAAGTITGRVTNADGSAAREVAVKATGDVMKGGATTNKSGVYRIDNLAPGDYRVSISLASGSRQWAHQASTSAGATPVTVTANGEAVLDEQLLPVGSITGRFTDAEGNGLTGVVVNVDRGGTEENISVVTDGDGAYRIDGVFADTYRVRFTSWVTGLDQWAHGATSAANATPIAIAGGQTSTVDDQLLSR